MTVIINMSTARVAAWDLFALSPPERWYEESIAYIDSAYELYASLAKGVFVPNWPRAKAGAFLLGHGLELFFKAAAAQSGTLAPWGHDLEALYHRYRELYPEERFAFESTALRFITEHKPLPYYDFLKYPERIAEISVKWDASIGIEVDAWQRALRGVVLDVRRLWSLILEKHPRDRQRWDGIVDLEFEKRRSR